MKVRSEHRHVEEMTALPKRAFISSTLCCLTRVWSIILSIYPVLAATGGRSLVVPLASLRIIPAGTDGFFWTDRSVIVTGTINSQKESTVLRHYRDFYELQRRKQGSGVGGTNAFPAPALCATRQVGTKVSFPSGTTTTEPRHSFESGGLPHGEPLSGVATKILFPVVLLSRWRVVVQAGVVFLAMRLDWRLKVSGAFKAFQT